MILLSDLCVIVPVLCDSCCLSQTNVASVAVLKAGAYRKQPVQECMCSSDNPCSASSGCLNFAAHYECDRSNCPAGEACQNHRMQQRKGRRLKVISEGDKGYGVRCHEDIPAGEFVIEYCGEVMLEDEFRKRLDEFLDEGEDACFYFMRLGSGLFIDAARKGNTARFINHRWVALLQDSVACVYWASTLCAVCVVLGLQVCEEASTSNTGAQPIHSTWHSEHVHGQYICNEYQLACHTMQVPWRRELSNPANRVFVSHAIMRALPLQDQKAVSSLYVHACGLASCLFHCTHCREAVLVFLWSIVAAVLLTSTRSSGWCRAGLTLVSLLWKISRRVMSCRLTINWTTVV